MANRYNAVTAWLKLFFTRLPKWWAWKYDREGLGYCPFCGACGEEGCCPPEKCKGGPLCPGWYRKSWRQQVRDREADPAFPPRNVFLFMWKVPHDERFPNVHSWWLLSAGKFLQILLTNAQKVEYNDTYLNFHFLGRVLYVCVYKYHKNIAGESWQLCIGYKPKER